MKAYKRTYTFLVDAEDEETANVVFASLEGWFSDKNVIKDCEITADPSEDEDALTVLGRYSAAWLGQDQ